MSESAGNGEFRQRLRMALSRTGISQAELARRIGVHPNLVNNWVAGRRHPSLQNLAALAPVLKVDIHWLVLGCSPPRASQRGDPIGERVRSLSSELIELVELARNAGD